MPQNHTKIFLAVKYLSQKTGSVTFFGGLAKYTPPPNRIRMNISLLLSRALFCVTRIRDTIYINIESKLKTINHCANKII